jgi:hypothetical protein
MQGPLPHGRAYWSIAMNRLTFGPCQMSGHTEQHASSLLPHLPVQAVTIVAIGSEMWHVQYRRMYEESIKDPETFWGKIAEEFYWEEKVSFTSISCLHTACTSLTFFVQRSISIVRCVMRVGTAWRSHSVAHCMNSSVARTSIQSLIKKRQKHCVCTYHAGLAFKCICSGRTSTCLAILM